MNGQDNYQYAHSYNNGAHEYAQPYPHYTQPYQQYPPQQFQNIHHDFHEPSESPFPSGTRPAMQKVAPMKLSELYDIEDDEESPRKRRCICGCIPRDPLVRAYCICILVVVLAVLAVAMYFLFPRPPNISVTGMTPAATQNAFSVSGNPLNPAQMSFSASVIISASVNSPNPYPIILRSVDVSAAITPTQAAVAAAPNTPNLLGIKTTQMGQANPADAGKPHPIGSGSVATVILPAKQATSIQLPFSLTYSPDVNTGLIADPLLSEILQACGVTAPRRKLSLVITTAIGINPLLLVGYKPSFTNTVNIDCPFNDDILNGLLNKLGSSVSSTWSTGPPLTAN